MIRGGGSGVLPRWLGLLMLYLWRQLAEARAIQTGCVWRSSISPSMPFLQELRPWSWCSDGELHWYYPKGGLRVNFRQDVYPEEFRLCLTHGDWKEQTQVVHEDTTPSTTIYFSTAEPTLACIPSSRGQVNLLFQSSATDRYVNKIKYEIQPP